MTALETRYRRLLRWYPRTYRAEYEDEMLGVLMAAATPGQRRPRLPDRLDLLAAAVRTRLGARAAGVPDGGWTRAAAVVGRLGPMLLAAAYLRPQVAGLAWSGRLFADQPALPWSTWALVGAWTGVAVLAGLRARPVAAGAAWLALAADVWWHLDTYALGGYGSVTGVWSLALGATIATAR